MCYFFVIHSYTCHVYTQTSCRPMSVNYINITAAFF
uniref:Uncharacterized protein n=1 Tax=Anguilla anguilla TaxID=7936 RepID=A0A0E9PNT4_ANGAN